MKLGLVLGGGTAKGAFQLGALKVLQKVFPPESLTCISASSIGIMNAYAYSTGQLAQAEYVWTHLPFEKVTGFARYIRKEGYFEEMFAPLALRRVVNPFFYTVYFQLSGKTLHYVNLSEKEPGEYLPYLKAGVAIPPFCRPVLVEGQKCIDGAIVDNIPITPMADLGCDYIIAIYFDETDYDFVSPELDRRVLRLNLLDHGFIKDTFSFDEPYIRSMIQKGEQACAEKLKIWEPLIRAGRPASEAKTESDPVLKRSWYTGDMLLNRVNTTARKLTRIQIDERGART